jgi:signal transduction histidine kinase
MSYHTALMAARETGWQRDEGKENRDALNHEIEAILARVTHAFRSPLWALNGFAGELLTRKTDALDEEAQAYVGHVGGCGRRLNDLLERLVEFRDAARGLADIGTVELSSLLEDELLHLTQWEPHRKLSVSIEPRLTATGDAIRLRTVVRHLLTNAWKFTAARPVTHIAFAEVPDAHGEGDNCMRTFRLADNGVGYAPEMAGRLFLPFERLHPASEYEGAGMGLATVRRIVHLHGGRVWSESDEANGATFFFSLPR